MQYTGKGFAFTYVVKGQHLYSLHLCIFKRFIYNSSLSLALLQQWPTSFMWTHNYIIWLWGSGDEDNMAAVARIFIHVFL